MAASAGRYKDVTRATMPGELPREGAKSPHDQVRHGLVDDPNPSLRGRRQRAAINIKTDALESEYAQGRVTPAAYLTARTYKAVLERLRRSVTGAGSWNVSIKVDQVINYELKILGQIEKAAEADAMVRNTAPAIGLRGHRVLELVFLDEVSLTEVARRMTGAADRQDVITYSPLFRDGVEALAER